jgi:hypothetical protein
MFESTPRGNGDTALPRYTCNNLVTPPTDATTGALNPLWRHRFARLPPGGVWRVYHRRYTGSATKAIPSPGVNRKSMISLILI